MAVLKDVITGDVIIEQKVARTDLPSSSQGVEVPRLEYLEHQSRLELINALLGGTQAMKDAGQTFLPKEPAEGDVNYTNRLKRTYLFNAFGRTTSYLGGQVFTQPVRLLSDVPSEIRTDEKEGYEEDIDLKGHNLDAFLKPVFERGIAEGVSCILVDYPSVQTTGAISVADEKKVGLRPYWVHLPSSAIIGWKTKIENGKTVFTQLRIRETEEVSDGEYGVNQVNRIRVLYPGSWQLYEERTNKSTNQQEWFRIASGTTTLKVIPLAVFMPGKKVTELTAEPPLEDLAYMNLAHWQSTSDQMNILHFTRLPILFGKKIAAADKLDQIEIGPNRMIHSDSIEGDMKYVEHTGKSIAEGHLHLVDLETKMAMWGLQLLLPKTGSITATEKALSSGESDSTLKSWALLFKDFIEQCLYLTALYLKKDSGGSAEVNSNFRWSQTLDSEVLLRAAQLGILPGELVFKELQLRGIVSDFYSYDNLLDMFEDNPMSGTGALTGAGTTGAQPIYPDTEGGTLTRSQTGTSSPFGFKRGSGRKGG
jgi:hypothetical protein